MTTLLYTHPASLEHDAGPGHPELPARMRAIEAAFAQDGLEGVLQREPPQASARAARTGARRSFRRAHPRRGAAERLSADRCRHGDVARLRRGGAARGGCGLRGGRRRARRRGGERLLCPAPARPPCRAGSRDGLLPVQPGCGRRPPGSRRPRPRPRLDLRFRRPSRQRHPGGVRARAAGPVPLDPPVAALSRYGRAARDRHRQHRQPAAAGGHRLEGVARRGRGRHPARRSTASRPS